MKGECTNECVGRYIVIEVLKGKVDRMLAEVGVVRWKSMVKRRCMVGALEDFIGTTINQSTQVTVFVDS